MTSIQPLTDTIAAIATPGGTGGLAVVRLSGPKSCSVTQRCLRKQSALNPFEATFSRFFDPKNNTAIDEVIVTYFQAPKSYTAEDVVEISCHGGHYIARQILNVLLAQETRMAEPGEFTKRAFLNGRIDLTQAEAVSDLINAQTTSSHKVALQQLDGQLKKHVSGIRQDLIDTISLLELELDFSEDELEKTPYNKIISAVTDIKNACREMVQSYSEGRIYRNGILVPIIGKPNAGKSSILNTLLKQERALVSDIPGTTRDTIEESISHKGIEIRLVDTAGLRTSEDYVESLGISRTEQMMEQADVLLHIIDLTDKNTKGETIQTNGIPVIDVYNKTDLISNPEHQKSANGLYTSTVTLEGIDQIGNAIIKSVLGDNLFSETPDSVIVTNERHRNALEAAIQSFNRATESAHQKMSSEFIIMDLRAGLESLGLLTGETTTDDILNNIFEHFCIGK